MVQMQGYVTINFWDQKVKYQGHRRHS